MKNMKKKVIVRTYSAGVHYGTLESATPMEGGFDVTLSNTRRIWSWKGANSLSELGTLGTSDPSECKFSLPLLENRIVAIEIITVTPEAIKNLEAVKFWAYNTKDDINEILKNNNL